MTKQDVQQEQVDRSAITFDYFANDNQAGVVVPVTGLDWVPDNDDCLILLLIEDYVFKKPSMN